MDTPSIWVPQLLSVCRAGFFLLGSFVARKETRAVPWFGYRAVRSTRPPGRICLARGDGALFDSLEQAAEVVEFGDIARGHCCAVCCSMVSDQSSPVSGGLVGHPVLPPERSRSARTVQRPLRLAGLDSSAVRNRILLFPSAFVQKRQGVTEIIDSPIAALSRRNLYNCSSSRGSSPVAVR